MPLSDIDVVRRRNSIGLPTDLVDYIVYSYNEQTFEESHFQSIDGLINLIENDSEKNKCHWIEVVNGSSIELPDTMNLLCEHFGIHPLTIEDVTTLAPYMKVDFFNDQGAVYLLMKIISWNGQRVEQQQISFYLKNSQNLLITFQEKSSGHNPVFDAIRHRLRRQASTNVQSTPYNHARRLKQMNIDYLFYCLFDAIIDRYMLVLEEISTRIDEFDEKLMTDKKSLTLPTLHSIYYLKHDLLHLRILFNPLKEIIYHLQRTIEDDQLQFIHHPNSVLRLNLKHHLIRRKLQYSSMLTTASTNNSPEESKDPLRYFNEYIYAYFSDLNDHINQLIDSLEIQRENVALLISFWIALNSDETQQTLKFLMLLSVLFMPCLLLSGIYSTNFNTHPEFEYQYGYFIILACLGAIIIGMLTCYKVKRWI